MPLPRDPIKRRRLAALLCAAAAATVSGAAVGAGAGDERERAERPRPVAARAESGASAPSTGPAASSAGGLRSPAAREAGRTIVMRFAGTAPPGYVLRALRERRAAGVILFRDNVTSPGQLRAMTAALQRAAGGTALIMIDQEGGAIRNVPWAAPVIAPPGIATAGAARASATATARDLRAAGVNVNLAPVADVASVRRSVMRSRAFPGAAPQVGRLVAATVRGYAATGVLPTAKHFPGLGRSTVNTDLAPATVAGRGELAPFVAAIDAGVPLVMSSHALYAQLDRTRIASQSRRIMTTLLRERLGFDGVAITDSLEARAVVTRSSTPTAAARSLVAGNDLLLTTGKGSYLRVLRRLIADAKRSSAFRARLREAGDRAERLRTRLRRRG
jgi:beta-N-acetylhexosaminidase